MFAGELVNLWVVFFGFALLFVGFLASLKVLAPHMPTGLASLLGGV